MIRDLLTQANSKNKIAIIDGDNIFKYKDILYRARSIQKSLPELNKEIVAIFLPNSSDFVSSLFSLFLLNITAFPLHCYMTKYEIFPLLKQASVTTIITSIKFRHLFEEIQQTFMPSLVVIYLEDVPTTWDESILPKTHLPNTNPLLLLTTSGSTGKNRLVPLSVENVSASVGGYIDKMNFDKKSSSNIRYLLASPFTSAYGLMILFACLTKSFPLILLKDGFTIDNFYKTAEIHRATHYEGGASVLLIMEQTANKVIPYDISRLKDFGFGGSKISGNTLRKLSATFPDVRFCQGYGMTEAAPLITKYADSKMEKLDSVGTAITNVEIFIDTTNGITDKPHVQGEIIVKGPNIMKGYYNDQEETNKILKNKYLYTGDIGYVDDDGYLYICGRKKNIIISQGLNVYPEEVEACLLDSLLIKECMVYGETDSSGNEYICADIVPISTTIQIQQIKQHCTKYLAPYKNPKKITIVDEIKKVGSGKINRSLNTQ